MGVLDWLGANSGTPTQGGVLGAVSQQPSWTTAAGLFGSALKDASASLSGRPEDANSLQQFIQQNRALQARQALAADFSSQDPAARQQAYQTALTLGIDPTPYQKMSAQAALPRLMGNLQPAIQSAPTAPDNTPIQNAQGQFNPVNVSPEQVTKTPTSLADALQLTGNPELTSEYAPQIIAQQQAANAPYTLDAGASRFVGNQKVASAPIKPDFNQPFNVDGTPNAAYQAYQKQVQAAGQAPAWANVAIANKHLQLDQQRMQAGIPNDDTLHDMAVRYVSGDKTAAGSLGRNPIAQTAFQNMISQVGREKGLKPEQISQNQQTFQAAGKAVQAFDTGKQGDTTRSLNVFVQHSALLDQLADAMHNGDMKAINSLSNVYKTQFGDPAPTNLQAVAQIYANELQKATLGAPGGEAERQALAAAANPNVAPDVIHGLTTQGRKLAAGQLSGLRQQFVSSTSRPASEYDAKLSPETLQALPQPLVVKPPPANTANLPRLNGPKIIKYDAQGNRVQ